jgi:hypothetical protein
MQTVVEYRPESPIQDLVWLQSIAETDRSNVTDLRTHRLRTVRSPSTQVIPQLSE